MEQTELYDLQAAASIDPDGGISTSVRTESMARWLHGRLRSEAAHAPEIVEFGFGDAELSFAICQRLSTARLRGLDISSARVQRANALAAQAGLSGRVRFEQLDADRQLESIESGSADLVIAIDVLEHVFDVFGFVNHMARVVRKSGLVVLRVPNLAYIRHRWALLRGRLPVTSSWFGPANDLSSWREIWGWDGGHIHNFTMESLGQLLRDTGLRPLDWRDPGTRAEGLRRLAPSLLIGNLCVLARRE